jgi:hypothetical protein
MRRVIVLSTLSALAVCAFYGARSPGSPESPVTDARTAIAARAMTAELDVPTGDLPKAFAAIDRCAADGVMDRAEMLDAVVAVAPDWRDTFEHGGLAKRMGFEQHYGGVGDVSRICSAITDVRRAHANDRQAVEAVRNILKGRTESDRAARALMNSRNV